MTLTELAIAAFGKNTRALTDDEVVAMKAGDWAVSEIAIIDDVAGTDNEAVCDLVGLHARSPEERGQALVDKAVGGLRLDNFKRIFTTVDPPLPVKQPATDPGGAAPAVVNTDTPAGGDPEEIVGGELIPDLNPASVHQPGGQPTGGAGGQPRDNNRGDGEGGDHGGGTPGKRQKESIEDYKARMARDAAELAVRRAEAEGEAARAKAALVAAEEQAAEKEHHRHEEEEKKKAFERRREEARTRHANKPPPTAEGQARIDAAVKLMRDEEQARNQEAIRRRDEEEQARINAQTPKPGMTWLGYTVIGFCVGATLFCGGIGLLLVL